MEFNSVESQQGVIDRLNDYIEYDAIVAPTAFAIKAGLDPSGFSKMLKGQLTITKKTLKRISDTYNISLDWLITGEGEMLKSGGQKEKTFKGGIPFYENLPVSAGNLDVLVQDAEPTGWLNLPGVTAKALFPVVGCSMKPEINPGDVIGVVPIDAWEMVDPDKVYLVITHEDRMIKHLAVDDTDKAILWCISPNYPKFKIDKADIKFIYRVSFCGKLM